jgi:hypothetical protein
MAVISPRSNAVNPARTSSTFSCDIARQVSRSVYPAPTATAQSEPRVEKVVAYPPLSELGADKRREFHEALLDADTFEDLPGKWQAAILTAEQKRPNLGGVSGDLLT